MKADCQGTCKCLSKYRFEEAMQHYTMDFVRQMETIKTALDSEEATESEEAVQEKERLLEELMEIVEHIDYARGMLLKKCFTQSSPVGLCYQSAILIRVQEFLKLQKQVRVQAFLKFQKQVFNSLSPSARLKILFLALSFKQACISNLLDSIAQRILTAQQLIGGWQTPIWIC